MQVGRVASARAARRKCLRSVGIKLPYCRESLVRTARSSRQEPVNLLMDESGDRAAVVSQTARVERQYRVAVRPHALLDENPLREDPAREVVLRQEPLELFLRSPFVRAVVRELDGDRRALGSHPGAGHKKDYRCDW